MVDVHCEEALVDNDPRRYLETHRSSDALLADRGGVTCQGQANSRAVRARRPRAARSATLLVNATTRPPRRPREAGPLPRARDGRRCGGRRPETRAHDCFRRRRGVARALVILGNTASMASEDMSNDALPLAEATRRGGCRRRRGRRSARDDGGQVRRWATADEASGSTRPRRFASEKPCARATRASSRARARRGRRSAASRRRSSRSASCCGAPALGHPARLLGRRALPSCRAPPPASTRAPSATPSTAPSPSRPLALWIVGDAVGDDATLAVVGE